MIAAMATVGYTGFLVGPPLNRNSGNGRSAKTGADQLLYVLFSPRRVKKEHTKT
jgi:hypothetical protein